MPSPQVQRRVVASFKTSFEHSSEKDRARYLKEHPKANPKNHSVKKPSGKAPAQESEAEQAPGKKPPEAAPAKGKGFLKSLSSKAKSFLSKSSEAVQKFVVDPKHRAAALKEAGKEILASPKKYAQRLVKHAVHEVHEFKEAGQALVGVMGGKELTPKQKKTLKTVAVHLSIAVAAAALTSTGLVGGAAVFAKGLSKKIAIKAAIESMEKIHTLEELSHIGHGIGHLVHASTEEKLTPEEAFAVLVMQNVVKQLESLDETTVTETLEKLSGS